MVTLVTDVPASRRAAYVGLDNRAAGATAAYLIAQWLGRTPGDVLVVRGNGSYRGEDERSAGFRAELSSARRVFEIVDDEDRPAAVAARARAVLHHDLRHDLRRACLALLRAGGVLPGVPGATPSAIQVITPHNAPPVGFG